jgi:hypothetical protein
MATKAAINMQTARAMAKSTSFRTLMMSLIVLTVGGGLAFALRGRS